MVIKINIFSPGVNLKSKTWQSDTLLFDMLKHSASTITHYEQMFVFFNCILLKYEY